MWKAHFCSRSKVEYLSTFKSTKRNISQVSLEGRSAVLKCFCGEKKKRFTEGVKSEQVPEGTNGICPLNLVRLFFFVTHMYIFLHVPCLSTVLPDEREFQHAAKMNNLETMEKLFKKNLNINAVDTVSTACQKCDACGVAWRKPSVLLLNVSPSWMCLSSVPHVQDVLKSFTQHNPQVFFLI